MTATIHSVAGLAGMISLSHLLILWALLIVFFVVGFVVILFRGRRNRSRGGTDKDHKEN